MKIKMHGAASKVTACMIESSAAAGNTAYGNLGQFADQQHHHIRCIHERTLCNKVRCRMTACDRAHLRRAVQCVCLSVRELGISDLTSESLTKAADGDSLVRCFVSWTHIHLGAVPRCIILSCS